MLTADLCVVYLWMLIESDSLANFLAYIQQSIIDISSLVMDKVYIDGPSELHIRRSIDKCSRIFFVIRKFLGVHCTEKNWNYPESNHICIRTVPIGPIYKSESCDSLFRNERAKHGPSNNNSLSLCLVQFSGFL